MLADFKTPPRWLLTDIGLLDGRFETKTIVTGRPDAHNSAVLDVGNGPPSSVRIDLTTRANWREIEKRLTDEGFF